MKKLILITGFMLAISVLQACNHGEKEDSQSTDDTTATQDTSTKLNLSVDKEDAQFAGEAATGGINEITLGKLAIAKGKSKKIRNFGAMMVKDHGKINVKLMMLINSKEIKFPASADTAGQKTIAMLSAKSGSDFDKAYITAMLHDHEQDVAAFTSAAKTCQDPDLKAFAIRNLPVLQKHLDAITAIHDSME